MLYTDASDYAHGAYLCQLVPSCEMDEAREEPIRFVSGSFSGAQVRWSIIKMTLMQSIGSGQVGRPTGRDSSFTIRIDHRKLLYINKHGSKKVI